MHFGQFAGNLQNAGGAATFASDNEESVMSFNALSYED